MIKLPIIASNKERMMAVQTNSTESEIFNELVSDENVFSNENIDLKNTDPKNSANQKELADKLIALMHEVDPAHKVPYIITKIKTEKYDQSKALLLGDDYIESYIRSLDAEQLNESYTRITSGIKNAPQAMASKKTYNAVYSIVLGKEPKTTESIVKEAYQGFGEIFKDTLKNEELRQYNEANLDPKLKWRRLEETELKQCGHPYEKVFRDNLKHLQINKEVYEKFNGAIRTQLIRYQKHEITALELQIRLRYATAKLAIALDQAGYVAEAMAIRKEQFGNEYTGDGLTGAFVDRNKTDFNKPRPILTSKTRELAKNYLEKIKEKTTSLQAFLGFGNKPIPPGLKVSENLHKDVEDFIAKSEKSPVDEEARRRLYNRVHNVEQWYNYYQLELAAAGGIPGDDAILKELPFQRTELIAGFENHAEKLLQRLQPDDEKSYKPGIRYGKSDK